MHEMKLSPTRKFLTASLLVSGLLASATSATASSPHPDNITPVPAVDEPGDSSHNYPFFSRTEKLEEKGYTEKEFFFSGTANTYDISGMSTASVATTGNEYKTRMIVRRPSSPSQFNGTVIVEWLNVSGGYDIGAHWTASSEHFIREGYAWVGVSAQRVGVHNEDTGLLAWSPERYGSESEYGPLNIEDDQISYDIFSQAGQAIKSPSSDTAADIIGMPVQRVIAAGASQSAGRLARYYNAIHAHERGDVFDGFYLLIGGSELRSDLDTKVFNILSETEIPFASRQEDSDTLRTWEVAGASHITYSSQQVLNDLRERDGIPNTSTDCDKPPFSRIPFYHAQNAAYNHLVSWISTGTAPPTAPRIETSAGQGIFGGRTIERDRRGNALGGLQLSQHAVPTATNTGDNSGPGFCMLYGSHEPFSRFQLFWLYRNQDRYVQQVIDAVNENLEAGYIVEADAQKVIDQVQQNSMSLR